MEQVQNNSGSNLNTLFAEFSTEQVKQWLKNMGFVKIGFGKERSKAALCVVAKKPAACVFLSSPAYKPSDSQGGCVIMLLPLAVGPDCASDC